MEPLVIFRNATNPQDVFHIAKQRLYETTEHFREVFDRKEWRESRLSKPEVLFSPEQREPLKCMLDFIDVGHYTVSYLHEQWMKTKPKSYDRLLDHIAFHLRVIKVADYFGAISARDYATSRILEKVLMGRGLKRLARGDAAECFEYVFGFDALDNLGGPECRNAFARIRTTDMGAIIDDARMLWHLRSIPPDTVAQMGHTVLDNLVNSTLQDNIDPEDDKPDIFKDALLHFLRAIVRHPANIAIETSEECCECKKQQKDSLISAVSLSIRRPVERTPFICPREECSAIFRLPAGSKYTSITNETLMAERKDREAAVGRSLSEEQGYEGSTTIRLLDRLDHWEQTQAILLPRPWLNLHIRQRRSAVGG